MILLSVLSGCKKPETIRTSGTDTIDNTIYKNATTYYALGFSFIQAKKISNLADPGPDLTLYVNNDNPTSRLTLQVNNRNPSYCKVGEYQDVTAAITAFNNLKTIDVSQWQDMADPIAANQVWVYRTGRDQYAKFRIITTINEMRNNLSYGECTFQWAYQPDGSSTFPGK